MAVWVLYHSGMEMALLHCSEIRLYNLPARLLTFTMTMMTMKELVIFHSPVKPNYMPQTSG